MEMRSKHSKCEEECATGLILDYHNQNDEEYDIGNIFQNIKQKLSLFKMFQKGYLPILGILTIVIYSIVIYIIIKYN